MSMLVLMENASTIVCVLAENVDFRRKVNNNSAVTFLTLKITVTFIIPK